MRIRSMKPEFWRSPDITALAIEDRLLFLGLWSYVDDNGVGLDRLAAITADLFAGDLEANAPETFARVSRGLARLSDAGRIVRYTVTSVDYLEVVNWDKHQRIDKPGKPRYPRSDDGSAEIRETLARVTGILAPGTGEQGNRGTGEQTLSSPRGDGAFAEFYMAYPRKVGKDSARKAFEKAGRKVDPQLIIAGAVKFAADPNLPDKQFIPHPATWLNAGRWDDEPLPQRADVRPPSDPEQDWMFQ